MSPPRQTVSREMPSLLTTVPSYSARSRSLALPASQRRGSAIATAIGLRKKNDIEIVLDGADDFVHSYSTYDDIKGCVDVKFEKETSFDEVAITFEGTSCTYVEKIATTAPTTGRTTGRHVFLKVQQPIAADCLPEDSIFEAGVTYTVPFTFVVPDSLLPFICSHKTDNEEIRRDHLQLPPSLGDPTVSGDGHTLMDDLAPDMSKISYSVRARVTKWNAAGKLLELADRSERVRIVPGKQEAPPVNVDDSEAVNHVMRKEKSVKKGLFKIGKVGRLTAETTQPKSLRLPHPQKRQTEPVSTMAIINLRFDPASSDDQPPQMDCIVSKLKVYTFFGAAPYKAIPEVRRHDNWSTLHGIYPESIQLSSRALSTVSWIRHDPMRGDSFSSDLSRRPSGFSTMSSSSIPEPSCTYESGSPFYTACLPVPISLPTPSGSARPKVFVPTFHSCLISRTYSVELNISFRTPGANVSSSHVTLKTPIQISSEGGVPPIQLQETEATISAEIEQQFGLYEARQLEEAGLGLESPVYQEMAPEPLVPGTRHLSLAHPSSSSPDAPLLQSGVDSSAPPEYRAGAFAYSARNRPGRPRTQVVSLTASKA